MAIYHCSCKVISRGKGKSSVGASAYRSGDKIKSEYDGKIYNYTRKTGVVYSEVMLCENAPEKFIDRKILWNEVEKIEKGNNAQLSREYEIALPKELTREEQIKCVRNIARRYLVNDGMCADINIHDKGDGNPHVHIMCTMRPIDEAGNWMKKSEKAYVCKNKKGEERSFTSKELKREENKEWKKQYYYSKDGKAKGKIYLTEYEKNNNPKYIDYRRVKDRKYKDAKDIKINNPLIEIWNSKEYLKAIREGVEEEINKTLIEKGLEERVDCRSYKERGIERIPTIHEGYAARQMQKKGKESDRVKINEDIKLINKKIEKLNEYEDLLEKYKNQIKDLIKKESKKDYLDIARKFENYRNNYIDAIINLDKVYKKINENNQLVREKIYINKSINESLKNIINHEIQINKYSEVKMKLGLFKGKEKKRLEGKINTEQKLKEREINNLKSLGVSDRKESKEFISKIENNIKIYKDEINKLNELKEKLKTYILKIEKVYINSKLKFTDKEREIINNEQLKIRSSAPSRESNLIFYEAMHRANALEPKKTKDKTIERDRNKDMDMER